jgi:DUF2924 family protein
MLETDSTRTDTRSKTGTTSRTETPVEAFCSNRKGCSNIQISEPKRPMYPQEQIREQIRELDCLDLEGLRSLWQRHYGPPPGLRSVQLLRLTLAWRLQAEVFGGLEKKTINQLIRTGPVRAEGLELGIGAVFRRNWKGCTIEVVVEEQGFRWEGRTFRSLSAVATAIAGTRWNGPRFFGLRQSQMEAHR